MILVTAAAIVTHADEPVVVTCHEVAHSGPLR